jgi:S1-C subfamily serine protease
MALGGMLLEELSETDRETRGLKKDQLALRAKHVGEYGEHAAAKKAGFKKDDVLVEIESSTARQSESELIGRMLRDHKPGEAIKAVVLRGNDRIELAWPIQ